MAVSAKGRGAHRGGDTDYYPSPNWCVDRLLENCGTRLLDPSDITINALEPTVGDGAIVRAVDAWCARSGVVAPKWTGVELRRGALDSRTRLAHHVEGVDFRAWAESSRRRFDVCIGNPPFNLFESIARRALAVSDVTVLLLRVSVLESEERIDFWRTVGRDPALRVLPQRPSFDGEGTDSCAYAWFVWGHPQIRGVEVLDDTPIEIRNAQKPNGLHVDPRQVSLFDEVRQ
jgi:predicted nucleic acid-binding protein